MEVDMSTHIAALDIGRSSSESLEHRTDRARYLALVGRALFVAIFLTTFSHFSRQTIDYAAQQGVPLAWLAVPLSGVIALAGALSILVGYKAKLGAWLLVLFLVPVTLTLHRFWGLTDPMAAMLQRVMFLKNLSILGGALLIAYFGAGPLSLDARARRQIRT
jgi:putative oxidoreductase